MLRFNRLRKLACLISVSLVLSSQAYPCTSLFLPNSPDAVLAVNMDSGSGTGVMYVNKRDVQKTAVFVGYPLTSLQWTSKYMSLTISQTGVEFPWEGMNEKGLAVSLLTLATTQLPVGSNLPAVNGLQFLQYLLDTSANTAEAVAAAQNLQVAGPFGANQHYFLCDASGACATIEYLHGSLVIQQGANLPYLALANNNYQASLDNLGGLLTVDTTSQILALTGTGSLTRFEKAAILSSLYSPQSNDVSYAFSSLASVQEGDTQWSLAFTLASQTLQWKTTKSPTIKSVNLNQFDPHCSTGVEIFHVNSKASADVTTAFYPYTTAENDNLAASNLLTGILSIYSVAIVEDYPGTLTTCTEENILLSSSTNPSSSGQSLTLSAKVRGAGSSVPTGSVTFLNSAAVLGTVALDATGTAQLSVSNLPLGTNTLSVTYAGDASNASAVSPSLLQNVYAYSSQTTVTSSANPFIVNQPVTLTATVSSPQGTPTGSVIFEKNGIPVATVPLTGGQASLTYTFTSEGSKLITALYSGDANFMPSVSPIFSEGIGAEATMTSLSSSSNPSIAGQVVTLTVNISLNEPGTVTFYNGVIPLGTADVVGGQASLNYAFGHSGMKALTAVFSSPALATSTSPVLVQTVQ